MVYTYGIGMYLWYIPSFIHKLGMCLFFFFLRTLWQQTHLWGANPLIKGAVPWAQTCSFVSLVLKSSAVAVFTAMILTSLEFSSCNQCSKFLRDWE